MTFWTSDFLDKIRAAWLDKIKTVQYYAGGSWYDAKITDKRIVDDAMQITSTTTDSETLNITKMRLIDKDGEVAAEKELLITKTGSQQIINTLKLPLYEVDEDAE